LVSPLLLACSSWRCSPLDVAPPERGHDDGLVATGMLRNVMMLSAGGLVLFGKEYAAASTGVALPLPRLLGSLLTALLTKSVNATGMAVRYIELSHTAISLVTDDGSGTTCALFHDVADGAELGRLLAAELLRAFVDAYRGELRAETARTSAFEGAPRPACMFVPCALL